MTYESAIALIKGRYGEENQLVQTAEECAELAKAAIKRYRVLAAQDPCNEDCPWAILWESEHTSGVIQRFPDRKQAEDALVRLFIGIRDETKG